MNPQAKMNYCNNCNPRMSTNQKGTADHLVCGTTGTAAPCPYNCCPVQTGLGAPQNATVVLVNTGTGAQPDWLLYSLTTHFCWVQHKKKKKGTTAAPNSRMQKSKPRPSNFFCNYRETHGKRCKREQNELYCPCQYKPIIYAGCKMRNAAFDNATG